MNKTNQKLRMSGDCDLFIIVISKLKVCILQAVTILCVLLAVGTSSGQGQEPPSAAKLLEEFESSKVFYKQFDIGKSIAALHDTNLLRGLTNLLIQEDRHRRANAAFIFAALGDDRGFETLREILSDRSDRLPPAEVNTPGRPWSLKRQITSDRYYAVHVFGDLKDSRAVPVLIPLLHDEEINYEVAIVLGDLGDKRAISPLIDALGDKNPDLRVYAIYGLQELKAKEALPHLQLLIGDQEHCHFGRLISVGQAAQETIAKLMAP